MSAPTAAPPPPVVTQSDRLEVVFDRMAEIAGQRNALDAELVDLVAEIDRDGLWGITGARSLPALVGWKLGLSSANAKTLATLARRVEEFPRCVAGLSEGALSLDQVGAIAARAGAGADDHYAQLAPFATVNQLITALRLEPRPQPEPTADTAEADQTDAEPEPAPAPAPEAPRGISKTGDELSTTWRITLPHDEAAVFDAALASHLDRLVGDWTHRHPDQPAPPGPSRPGRTHLGADPAPPLPPGAPPMPTTIDAFLALITAGWDTDVAARPHGARTTVVVHVDLASQVSSLHLGPLLTDADRRYLTCDATCEAWFERDGQPIGAGRATRTVNRRLRRALEHRDRCCVVPGCGATRALHAHHLIHWEDGGPTELWNLVLLCPFHHRAHHRGDITLTGPADHLVVTDAAGHPMTNASLARPPTTPTPPAPRYRGPTGERADWWWYDPYDPGAPTRN
jgi:hypothetical protein